MTTRKTTVRRTPTVRAAAKKPGATASRKAAAQREPTIWEKIIEIGKQIPPEERARHPRVGAANLDHYLYGVPTP